MIEPATVYFTNGNSVDVVRARIKDSGWVAANVDGREWVYYPPQQINRIVSRVDD